MAIRCRTAWGWGLLFAALATVVGNSVGAAPEDPGGFLPPIFEAGAKVSIVTPPPEMTIEDVRGNWLRVSKSTWVHAVSGVAWEQRAPGWVVQSQDNLMTLVKTMLMQGPAVAAWPQANGKAFVLWPLATGVIEPTPETVLVFFTPIEREERLRRTPIEAWKELTPERLRDTKARLSRFTSYAGRRNLHPEHRITADVLAEGGPVLADLSFRDEGFVLVAFSNTRVQRMTRADLGLGPDDPIVVGDASRSPILRPLSDE